jgi:hypothetical protein
MRKSALILAMALVSGAALAQPMPPDAGPPPGGPPPPGMQGGPPPGMAGPPQHMRLADRFAAANVTRDGRLTMDQAQAAGWKPVVRHFADIDRDHKGYVTLQDVQEFHREVHAAKAAQQQGAPPPGQPMPPQGGPPPGAPPPGQPY